MIFPFTLENTIAIVFLQKNDEGHEKPIAYLNKYLIDAKLKYTIREKWVYALAKSLKRFRGYILQSHIVSYVPHISIKDIL